LRRVGRTRKKKRNDQTLERTTQYEARLSEYNSLNLIEMKRVTNPPCMVGVHVLF
jgi:hypothetical protein